MSEKLGFLILRSDKLSKDVAGLWPLVDLVTTLICKDKRIMTVYNDKWGAFTLPMSKRRQWKDAKLKDEGERLEEWDDAAVRVAAEWLGCTLTTMPDKLTELSEFQQSDRDEKWKRYRVHVYLLNVAATEPAPGRIVEWLTPEELLDEHRRPISPTARFIIAELRYKGLLQ